MKPFTAARAFLRAPRWRKRLAVEALWNLGRARLVTLLPANRYVRTLGALDGALNAYDGSSDQVAAEIGRLVAAVADVVPFRAACIQQAIAVRRMLRRRGVPASVYLGVSRDRADRAAPALGRAAHAWVEVGAKVISGSGDLKRYVVVARFA